MRDPGPRPLSLPRVLDRAGLRGRQRRPLAELDKMFSPSVRAVIQLIVAARTGEAHYARSFAQWPAMLAAIEGGAVDLEASDTLADRWVASGVLLLNSSLTLTRFQREGDRIRCAGTCLSGVR